MLKRSGVESKVPYLLTTAEGRPLGGELRHAFIQSIFLPLNFAKATLNILHSTARDQLIRVVSAIHLKKHERIVITNSLDSKNESFTLEGKAIIWDILIDRGVSPALNPKSI